VKVEVRCCCVPQKLLGWLDVEPERIVVGNVVQFRTPPSAGPVTFLHEGFETFRLEPGERVALPVAAISSGTASWLALKSEETPLETLRRIPGFIENT